MDDKAKNHLVSANGQLGPRIDVLERIFDRIAQYEEEVRTGQRVPQSQLVVKKGKKHDRNKKAAHR